MTAQRLNAGKPRLDLIESAYLNGTGRVLGFGAEKYGEGNWKLSCNTSSHDKFVNGCYASMMRHLLAAKDGEVLDPESGLPHMYHVSCNAMFIDYYNTYKGEYVAPSEEA